MNTGNKCSFICVPLPKYLCTGALPISPFYYLGKRKKKTCPVFSPDIKNKSFDHLIHPPGSELYFLIRFLPNKESTEFITIESISTIIQRILENMFTHFEEKTGTCQSKTRHSFISLCFSIFTSSIAKAKES